MKNKALKLIKEYEMFKRGDRVVVGFSGGADSVALLYLLHKLKDDFRLTLTALHLNHKLRGEESDDDQRFCEEFCKKLSIPIIVKCADINKLAKVKQRSIEETARLERYRFFAETAADKTATAHTLSDSVETTIFNLARGTGPKGLGGIPPVRGTIVRPLLTSTREEIEEYCSDNNLAYCIDSTNLVGIYARNKIRLEVIPALKELNPRLETAVERAQSLVKSDSDYLEGIAKQQLEILKISAGYSAPGLKILHRAVANRVIMLLLADNNLDQSYDIINLIYEHITAGISGLQLSQNLFLAVGETSFNIAEPRKRADTVDFFSLELAGEELINSEELEIYEGKYLCIRRVECKEIENIIKCFPNQLKNLLDCDKMGMALKFRQRSGGDYFSPAGRGVSKSLKKLFNEAKVPLSQRDKLVVMEGDKQILWVEGFGASQLVVADSDSQKAVEIIVKNTTTGEIEDGAGYC